MKKQLLVLICLSVCGYLFAQTHTSVNVRDDVYKILDYGQMKGYIDFLPGNKPYSQKTVLDALDSMLEYEDELTENEINIINEYKSKYSFNNIEGKNSLFHLRADNKNEEFPMTFKYDFSLEGSASGGVYTLSDYSQWGFDFIPEIYFAGDFSKYFSYMWDGLFDVTKMPLVYLGQYYCGQDWYAEDGVEKTNRYINKYINTCYLPYGYNKRWDGQIYYLENLSAEGLESWPVVISSGINVDAEISSSFLNDNLLVSFGRTQREIAGMDNGSSLVLNTMARAFMALNIQANFTNHIKYTFLTGSLEYPNQEHILDSWYPEDPGEAHGCLFFQNNYSLNMFDVDFKYLHIDLGCSVIWPNRMQFGYFMPLTNFVEYQNHVGDCDNLGMFGDLKFRKAGLGEVWISVFADEINLKSNPLVDTRDMFAYQAGFKYIIPNLPFATLSFRYTRVEPYCYTHQSINYSPWFDHYIHEGYLNDGYSIGYYLDPNSDEFRLDFNLRPSSIFTCNASYQFIRHGADYGSQQVLGSSLYSELSPRDRDEYERYFLHDGAYNWMHILSFGGSLSLNKMKFPVQFTANIGLVYSYFTMVDDEYYTTDGRAENCSFSTPYSIVNTAEYPTVFGAVVTVGAKITF